MNATLLLELKKPINRIHSFASSGAESIAPKKAVACNFITVFEEALAQFARRFPDKYIAPICECEMQVRVEEPVVRRVLGFILEAMHSTGIWADGQERPIAPAIYKCLNGYGAVLELSDELVSLSHELMSQFAQKESMPSPQMAGWQLVRARDYIELHGGRLYVASPISEHGTGTCIRLYLPLSTAAARRASARLLREELVAV